jgi:Reverse transcriptase (RNA-dependent DNA polymerase)
MEIANTVAYLKNRSPTRAVATTSYELWYGSRPNLSHLKIIGSTAYIHVPKEKRIKLDVNGRKGIMIGYGRTNQYRIWDPVKEDIVISRDVVFIEGKRVEETPGIYDEALRTLPAVILEEAEDEDQHQQTPQRPTRLPTPAPSDDDEPEQTDPEILQTARADTPEIDEPTQRASGRANKGTFTTTRFEDEEFAKGRQGRHTVNVARKIDPDDEEEPTTVEEAINHPTHGKQWEKAIRDEVGSLIKNHTWDLVPRPRNRQVVTNKFVLKHKKNEIAPIIRLKARLIARGFGQVYGVDNLDTYAPVVKLASIRILLALAAIYGFEIHQMDVVTAFLAGELEEEIYMEQTEGFRVGTDKEDLVCLLRKSLYGLKQAPRLESEDTSLSRIDRIHTNIFGPLCLCQQGNGSYYCDVGGRPRYFRKESRRY